jgi:hypothetical protein
MTDRASSEIKLQSAKRNFLRLQNEKLLLSDTSLFDALKKEKKKRGMRKLNAIFRAKCQKGTKVPDYPITRAWS